MKRRTCSMAVVMLLAVALTAPATAESSTPEQDAYAARFLLINDRVVDLGEEVGTAISHAAGKTDHQLARQFRRFARRLGRLGDRLGQLIPPAEWAPQHDRLLVALRPVEADLRRIAKAARNHAPRPARRATTELIRHSGSLRVARRALYRTIETALAAP